jgi:hypothetical protein
MALHLKIWVTWGPPSSFAQCLCHCIAPPALPSHVSTCLPIFYLLLRSSPCQSPRTLTRGAATGRQWCAHHHIAPLLVSLPPSPSSILLHPIGPPLRVESDFTTSFCAQTWVEFSLKINYMAVLCETLPCSIHG